MTTTQRPRTPRRTAPPPGPNPASRGIILVVVGVVLGLILLAKGGGIGFDDDSSDVTIDTEDAAATTTTASTTTVPTTDRPPQSVKVVVANGSDVSGLAAKTAEFLAQTGYTSTVVTDSESQVSATVVYFAPGFESSAQAIARDLGLPETQVQALPPGAKLAGEQPTDAGVIVQLGPEVAAKVGVTTATTIAGGTATTTTTASGTGTSGTSSSSSGTSSSGTSSGVTTTTAG
jgi:hypothetical protein